MTAKFQSHINGLRAIAVIGVILFHFKLLGINSGFVGVDIFFVISGYLMTRILFENENSTAFAYFSKFWIARVRRIAPALIALTMVCLCVYTTILLLPDYRTFLRSNVTANLFLSNYFFLAQNNYFDTESDNKPLLHTWSLSLEWQFYLIYPFITYGLKKCTPSIRLSLLITLCLCSYFYCGILTKENPTNAYFQLTPRAWEFLIGAITYFISTNKSLQSKIENARLLDGLGLFSLIVILASLVATERYIFPGWIAVVPVIAVATVILTGGKGLPNSALSSYAFQIIGNLSYSLYLWHWPIYVYLVTTVAVDRPVNLIEKTIGLLLTLIISFISYRWIEQPLRMQKGYWSNKKVLALWITSILISLIALAISLKVDAASYRLPTYLANAEKALIDKNPRLNECFLDAHEAAARNYDPKLCRIGIDQTTQVDAILWGDSFADALQPMVENVLVSQKLSGVVSTLPGCLPFDENGYKKDSDRDKYSYCAKGLNQKTFQFISSTSSLKYIIMSANWSRYDKDILTSDFVEHVCMLKKIQRIPILIGPVPSPNYDVPRQWGQLELKNKKIINQMIFARSSVKEIEDVFIKLIGEITTSCGAVPYIMPSSIYCEENSCFAVKNGEAMYVDSVHLSNKGASLMRKELEMVLRNQQNK